MAEAKGVENIATAESIATQTRAEGNAPVFLCFRGCSTCAKARRWLDEHHVAYAERNIKTDNPSVDELRAWWAESGLPLRRLFNTSGRLYRKEHVREQLDAGLSDTDALTLLASDGMMVRRPILVGADFALFGFDEGRWSEALL